MKDVYQLSKLTGIGIDYYNAWAFRVVALTEGIEEVAKTFRDSPVKTYEDWFPPREFRDVITDKNRKRVLRLDEIARTANAKMTDTANFTAVDFKRTVNEVVRLMYGESHNIPYPKVEHPPNSS